MKTRIFSPAKVVLIVLALGILFICVAPIKSNTVTHLALMPVEKKLRSKIEFTSSTIWLPGGISLKDMSVVDERGVSYYCKEAAIKYNLPGLIFKREGIRFNLKEVKFYRDIGLLDSVANMLVISKIPDLEFKEINGILELRQNTVYLKDLYAHNNLMRIRGSGWVDRDGLLDCDATFSFYKNITDKIPDIIKATLLTKEDEGWMGISFKAYGNYKKPSLHLTSDSLKLNIMEGIFGNE